jgi:Co/Zn/Cd efflux system component
MSDCGCAPPPIETAAQKRALWIALILNAGMFVLEVWTGIVFNSAGLLADGLGLDMLSDAAVYAIALVAIGSSLRFKANAAFFSGVSLLILGIGLVLEVVRRLLTDSTPEGLWMIIIAMVALIVNVIVLRLLSRQRSDEVHMRRGLT